MNEEEKNKEKRKNAPLTKKEWLTFFLLPFFSNGRLLDTNTFNETEDSRFAKFGFDRKIKDAANARGYGCLFYFVIFIAIIIIRAFIIN